MRFFQANYLNIKAGRRYYIFLKNKPVRVKILYFEDAWFPHLIKLRPNQHPTLDIGIRVKRLDNNQQLPRLRKSTELYTRNGS